jgi:membrane-associated phospholipid phosphatase
VFTLLPRRSVAVCLNILLACVAWSVSAEAQTLVAPDASAFTAAHVSEPTLEPLALLDLSSVEVQDQAPPPKHGTGIGSLLPATFADFKAFPRRKSTWVILGIGAAAAAVALPFDDELNEELRESGVRKVFQPGRVIGYAWVQAGAAAGLYIVGRYVIKPAEGKDNRIAHIGFDLIRANIMTQALTYGIKYAVRRDRPTGECCSFPSGHASVTFATAAVLERHFGYRASWPTFLIGGYVAASRMFDNRHFLSDVLFGSALGIASGWTVVGRHGRDDYALLPVPTRGGVALMGTWTPKSHANAQPAGR